MPIFNTARFNFLLATLFLLLCIVAPVRAEVIDRIDVNPHESDAEIVIKFSKRVLYLRHTPLSEGKEVRIFIRLADPAVVESDLDQEIVYSLKTDRVPDVRAVFPELINGMLVSFSVSTTYAVRPGSDGQSIVITVPLLPEQRPVAAAPAVATTTANPAAQTIEETPAAVAPVLTSAEVETYAKKFIDAARHALDDKDAATALNRLNRVLSMPTNAQTEPAQALIGQAREMNGEVLKARAEYELYLKLFPAGASAATVRAQLAALPTAPAQIRSAAKAVPKEPGEVVWTYNGSLASYYYHGNSNFETLAPPAPGQIVFNQTSLSLVDQNSWINSLNLNARRHDDQSDTRIVVRDTDNHNYLNSLYSYNRLYSAYIDYNDLEYGYTMKFGRQNPNGMGVLERFDGMQTGYNWSPEWKTNVIYGRAVEFNSPYKKVFYGASVDFMPQTALQSVSVYALKQTVDGFEDRRAVGSELRYFEGGATMYGTLDYDTLYRGVNIALLQGNYLSDAGDNYFFILDHRKAPAYSLTNALPAFPGLSLSDLIKYQGMDQVLLQAENLTATSNLFAMGVTHPFSEKWQGGIDYRASSISSTGNVMAVVPLSVVGTCIGIIDPVNNNCIINTSSQQGSGLNHVLSFQGIGTNLFVPNAVGVANLSLIKAVSYKGEAFSLGYFYPVTEHTRLDSNLRYYNQRDDSDNKQDNWTASFKLSHQWSEYLYLEGEFGHEVYYSTNLNETDHTKRNYVYLGVRGDIH